MINKVVLTKFHFFSQLYDLQFQYFGNFICRKYAFIHMSYGGVVFCLFHFEDVLLCCSKVMGLFFFMKKDYFSSFHTIRTEVGRKILVITFHLNPIIVLKVCHRSSFF